MKDKQLCRSEKKHYRQQRFGVMAGSVQTWSIKLLFKFIAGRQFCAQKPARTQIPNCYPVQKKQRFIHM